MTETGAMFLPAHIKEGFFRKLISDPIKNRKAVRKELDRKIEEESLTAGDPTIINLNSAQLAYKKIGNSCYGFIGSSTSRVFNIILAATVTVSSQFLIRFVAQKCDKILQENFEK